MCRMTSVSEKCAGDSAADCSKSQTPRGCFTHSKQHATERVKALPEMVDRAVHAEERQDKGTGPAVTLPDEVAARVPRLAQPFLCDGSVQLAVVPPGKTLEN